LGSEELYAAIDETNDFEYLSFIVGLKEDIMRIEEKIPPSFTHMTRSCSGKSEKLELVNKFDFRENVLVHCAKFSIRKLKKKIDDEIILNHVSRKPKSQIYNILASEFRLELEKMYGNFVKKFGFSLNEIYFQVDNDIIRDLLKKSNLQYKKPQIGHRITDCVAHVNGKHWPTKSIIREREDDFKRMFHRTVITKITR
jgi:hypothetical protein